MVDTIWCLWCIDGKAHLIPKLVRVHGSSGSAEATQNQVVVCVVMCVLDCHVLDQTMVYAQDVVGMGVHLLSPAEHAPHITVLQPGLSPWGEVPTHNLKTCCGHVCCDILVPRSSLWRCQFAVDITGHQQRGLAEMLDDGCNNAIYGQGNVSGQIAPQHIPALVA